MRHKGPYKRNERQHPTHCITIDKNKTCNNQQLSTNNFATSVKQVLEKK